MKKYFTFTNIMLMLFPVAALIIAIVFGNTLAIAISGAFIICTGGLIYVMTRGFELRQENLNLIQQLDEVRRNRDDYMAMYKEYFNKYDAKVSECSILEQKVRDLQAVAEMKDVPSAAAKPTRVIKRSGSGKKKKISEIKEAVKDITDNAK